MIPERSQIKRKNKVEQRNNKIKQNRRREEKKRKRKGQTDMEWETRRKSDGIDDDEFQKQK